MEDAHTEDQLKEHLPVQKEEVSGRNGRVALVIGNRSYDHEAKLQNTLNDMNDIGAALGRLGFDVLLAADLPKRQLESQLGAFYQKVSEAETAMLYYAGHAIQHHGKNFLIPVDAKIERETDLQTDAIDLTQIVETISVTCPKTLAFLDSCRNNPFEEAIRRSAGRGTSIARGLAEITTTGADTFIAFSTAPGRTASDGDPQSRNSPFTRSVLKHIEVANLELSDLTRSIVRDVRTETQQEQNPWHHSSFEERFYFKKTEARIDDDQTHLEKLIIAKDVEAIRAFAQHNSNAALRDQAETALSRLEREKFDQLGRSLRPKDVESFIDEFPSSSLVEEAKRNLGRSRLSVLAAFSVTAALTGVVSTYTPSDDPLKVFAQNPITGFPMIWWNVGVALFGASISLLLYLFFRLHKKVAVLFFTSVCIGWFAAQSIVQVLPLSSIVPASSSLGAPVNWESRYASLILTLAFGLASLMGALISSLSLGISIRRPGLVWPVAAATISTLVWMPFREAPLLQFQNLAPLFIMWQMAFAIGLALVFLRRDRL